MSTRTDLRSVLGPLADVALPHLQGPVVTVPSNLRSLAQATEATLDIPLAETMFGFQRAGVKYVLSTKGTGYRAIIGHDMGCGKTIQAIACILALNTFPAIVICPPSLSLNWVKEFAHWAPDVITHRIVGTTTYDLPAAQVYIIGDSLIEAWQEPLIDVDARAIVIDEIHRFKSKDTKRTAAAKEIARYVDPFGLRLGLTGTITPNNPSELISQAQIIGVFEPVFGAADLFMDRYMPKTGEDQWKRASDNLDELFDRMCSTFYCRVNFEDVRDQLGLTIDRPQRLARSVEMTGAAARDYTFARDDLRDFLLGLRGEEAADRAMRAEALVRLNTLRRLIGKSKVQSAVKYIKDLVDQGEQVIVFAVHRDVTLSLAKAFDAPTIIGGQSVESVEDGKARFQAGEARVIVLNIVAGGVGHTLTAAHHVVFVEYGWNPGAMEQAEGRAYRIGQTQQVYSHWLSGSNGDDVTIDERLVGILNDKGWVTGAVIKGEGGEMIDSNTLSALLDWAAS